MLSQPVSCNSPSGVKAQRVPWLSSVGSLLQFAVVIIGESNEDREEPVPWSSLPANSGELTSRKHPSAHCLPLKRELAIPLRGQVAVL